jgi:Cof subfamily protein (haloacid dehalogenase superfamily)
MTYRLIAVDLDDSLLGSDSKISEANKRALFSARDKGVYVTIATGRMLDSAMPYIKELNIDIPVITYQGAFIKDTQTGDTLVRKLVPREHALRILEEVKKQNLHIQTYNESSYFFEQDNEFSRFYHKMTGIKGEEVEDLYQLLMNEEEPIKMIIIDEPSKIAQLYPYFQELYGDILQVSISMPEYLEFTNIDATKGNALALLGDMLEVPKEEIIAIGDSYNDISMIKYAGMGIAMDNAVDDVKSHAKYITKGNDENGVAEAIERFVLKKE